MHAGPMPHELYGKFTWRIDNFSEISKRELRSTVFEVGSYKWCGVPLPPASCHTCLPLAHADPLLASKTP